MFLETLRTCMITCLTYPSLGIALSRPCVMTWCIVCSTGFCTVGALLTQASRKTAIMLGPLGWPGWMICVDCVVL